MSTMAADYGAPGLSLYGSSNAATGFSTTTVTPRVQDREGGPESLLAAAVEQNHRERDCVVREFVRSPSVRTSMTRSVPKKTPN